VIKIDNQISRESDNQEISKFIGNATNNQAEYKAVIEALKWIATHRQEFDAELEIECLLDSQLIVEQLNQRYKLKNEGLKPLFWEMRDLIMKLGGKVTFKFIPREQNKEADRLVNEVLDSQIIR
ncbi:MAG: ribonuclease putative phosphoglycerate mutase, partial [Candidatus Berkelbacteria bacterium]|nr:ribonuclease putative phosphoglycerate mutase [Candidatus Berkelbacteria bacterium]